MNAPCILLVAAAFLAGSVPFGRLLFRLRTGGDIRTQGSGNIGATNVLRQGGAALGLATLALDVAKGAVFVMVARALCPQPALAMGLAGFAAVFGHCYPAWTLFRGGGKGVASAAGAALVFSPLAVFLALCVFVFFVTVTERVSVGSLAASAFLPAGVWLVTGSAALFWATVAMAVVIWWRHRANIGRLASGREPSVLDRFSKTGSP